MILLDFFSRYKMYTKTDYLEWGTLAVSIVSMVVAAYNPTNAASICFPNEVSRAMYSLLLKRKSPKRAGSSNFITLAEVINTYGLVR